MVEDMKLPAKPYVRRHNKIKQKPRDRGSKDKDQGGYFGHGRCLSATTVDNSKAESIGSKGRVALVECNENWVKEGG